jgi:L-threonylcarbamoyladenylate synthase
MVLFCPQRFKSGHFAAVNVTVWAFFCEPLPQLVIFAPLADAGIDIQRAAELIMKGELVAIPTETVYGLAANALNESAVLKIFQAKERPFFDPLIVHTHSADEVTKYARWHDDRLQRLASRFWPGPLTILLPKKNIIPGIVTSGLEQVAMRVPRHPLTLQLLRLLPVPLAAPSANPFGYVSPTSSLHVNNQLGDRLSYILDGGPSSVGLESTIVGVENNKVCIYRVGGLAVEEIEKICGTVDIQLNTSSDPKAPGQLKNHYSPRKPLFLGDEKELLSEYGAKKIALLTFGENELPVERGYVYNLSKNSDLNEAAVNLFHFLRDADESDAEIVIAGTVPDTGLGRAINDRLRRAAAR